MSKNNGRNGGKGNEGKSTQGAASETLNTENQAKKEAQENQEGQENQDGKAGQETIAETKTEDAKKKGPEVKVVSATYGKGENMVDVTKQVSELNNGGHNRKITNKLFGGNDPIKGKVKSFNMEYTVNGETRTFSAQENEKIELDLSVKEEATAPAETEKETAQA